MRTEIEYNGMLLEVDVLGGEPETRYYPGDAVHAELASVSVYDWDELAHYYGAKGLTPRFTQSLEDIANRDWREISDRAIDTVENMEDDVDPDDYDTF